MNKLKRALELFAVFFTLGKDFETDNVLFGHIAVVDFVALANKRLILIC